VKQSTKNKDITPTGYFVLDDSSGVYIKNELLVYLELKQRENNKSGRAKIQIIKTTRLYLR